VNRIYDDMNRTIWTPQLYGAQVCLCLFFHVHSKPIVVILVQAYLNGVAFSF
jgi:hypothetical protein